MKTEFVVLGHRVSIASQMRRRRLVVLIYTGYAALLGTWLSFPPNSKLSIILLVLYILLTQFLGGRTIRNGLVPAFFECGGDERQLRQRDHAFYLAYKWWDLTLIPVFLSWGLKINPLPLSPPLHHLFDRLPYVIVIGAFILYATLPQAILLWTEPDMESPNES